MATKWLEREVKLDADLRFEVPDLSRVGPGTTVVRRPVRRLVASYYDTPDLQLVRRGITLRRRHDRVSGGENLWTLKLPAGTSHARLNRNEHSWPGDQPDVPEEARFLVRGLARRSQLVMVAKLVTTRRSVDIVGVTGERLVEVDDDVVSVVAGVRQGLRFREIEVEVDEADDDLVDSIISLLHQAGASVGGSRPKLDRALGLEMRRTFDVDRPDAGATLEDLIRYSLASAMDRLLDHDPGIRAAGGDVEYVHQARVATRRLRSDLKLFSPVLDPAWTGRIRDELQWVGSMLGAVRDADVLADRLVERTTSGSPVDAPAFSALVAVLAKQRGEARSALLGAMETERYLQLLGELSAAVAIPPVLVNDDGEDGFGASDPIPSDQTVPAQPEADALVVDPGYESWAESSTAEHWPEATWSLGGPDRPTGAASERGAATLTSEAPAVDRPVGDNPGSVEGSATPGDGEPDVAERLGETDEPDEASAPDQGPRSPRLALQATTPAEVALPILLKRPLRQLRTSVRDAGKHPTDDELHQIRIRAKRLRYASEAASDVLGKEIRRLGERAGALQTVLGELHDSIVAEAWLRQTASTGTAAQAFAAGLLVAGERQRQEELRRGWDLTWRALAVHAKRFRA